MECFFCPISLFPVYCNSSHLTFTQNCPIHSVFLTPSRLTDISGTHSGIFFFYCSGVLLAFFFLTPPRYVDRNISQFWQEEGNLDALFDTLSAPTLSIFFHLCKISAYFPSLLSLLWRLSEWVVVVWAAQVDPRGFYYFVGGLLFERGLLCTFFLWVFLTCEQCLGVSLAQFGVSLKPTCNISTPRHVVHTFGILLSSVYQPQGIRFFSPPSCLVLFHCPLTPVIPCGGSLYTNSMPAQHTSRIQFPGSCVPAIAPSQGTRRLALSTQCPR